jgi:hypothetical protein
MSALKTLPGVKSANALFFSFIAVALAIFGLGTAHAHLTVAGALPTGSCATRFSFKNIDAQGVYTWVIEKPCVTFDTDPGIAGVVGEDDTNPQRKGQKVWNAHFNDAFNGGSIQVCKLQGEWTCGSGGKAYATGTIKDGRAEITLKPSESAVKRFASDKKYNKSLEGFTLVYVSPDGKTKGWVSILPDFKRTAANGSPAHALLINLETRKVGSPDGDREASQATFAATVKQ